jgi:7-cyano-7-deazaguanine synthase
MSDQKAVIIYSGGMDSTVALYLAVRDFGRKNVKAITFNYQSKHNDEEFLRAKDTCHILGVEHSRIDLSSIAEHLESNLLKKGGDIPEGHYAESNMKKTVVPFRNGIMLSIACGIAESWGASKVIIGNHAGDHAIYPDCRATFVNAMNEAMAYGTYINVNILSPFVGLTKTDIASLGNQLGVDWNNTYSCYKGGPIHCGLCSTCFERREAFIEAKVADPTPYLDQTPFGLLEKKYKNQLENNG